MPQRRNPLAAAPILRKGGAHQKTRSAERGQAKRRLQKEVGQWRGREAPPAQP
jgi:hypothetical protein